MENQKGIGIVSLEVKNIGILKHIQADLHSGLNIFKGGNGNGKSTILNSIKFAVEGAKSIPADLIRHGFDKDGKALRGEILLGLENKNNSGKFNVKLEVYRGKDGEQKNRLAVTKDGFNRPAPVEFLKTLLHEWNDPQKISDLKGSDLYQILMKYSKVNLSSFDEKIIEIKEDQKYLRKRKKDLGVKNPVTKVEEVNIEEKMIELEEIRAFNKIQDNIRKEQEKIKTDISAKKNEKLRVEEEIVELQRQIEEKNKKVELIHEEIINLDIKKSGMEKPKDNKPEEKIVEEIKEANTINKKAIEYKEYTKWAKDVEEINKKMTKNEADIKENEAKKDNAIKTADMPVPGLSLTQDKDVMYKGSLWSNTCESDRLLVGALIIINTTSDDSIRYMVIHRGESILSERRDMLDRVLKENDYTCLMQVATEEKANSEDGAFYIVDGEILQGGANDFS